MSINTDFVETRFRPLANVNNCDEVERKESEPVQSSITSFESNSDLQPDNVIKTVHKLSKMTLDHRRLLGKTRVSNCQLIQGKQKVIEGLRMQLNGSNNSQTIHGLNLQIEGLQEEINALTKVATNQDETPLAGRAQQEPPANAAPSPINDSTQAYRNLVARELKEAAFEESWTTDAFERKIQFPINGEGILAAMVRKKTKENDAIWTPIGYFDSPSWPLRRWAYAPQESGRVPVRSGDDKAAWMEKSWLKDHESGWKGPVTGTRYRILGAKKSGEMWWGENRYTKATDANGLEYIMIPASSQGEYTGYVPARQLNTSLKKDYLTSPHSFSLVADKEKRLFIACSTILYGIHGFSLCSISLHSPQLGEREVKVWWPARNGSFSDDKDMKVKVTTIVNAALKKFGYPTFEVEAPAPNPGVDIEAPASN